MTAVVNNPPPIAPNNQLGIAGQGYIERLVVAIKNLVVRFFLMICPCFRSAPSLPPPEPLPPPPPPVPDVHAPDREALARLQNTLMPDQILGLFNQYFTEEEREPIYLRVGRLTAGWFCRDPQKEGKKLIETAPILIIPDLMQKIQRRIPS